jgi:hypothetical protein
MLLEAAELKQLILSKVDIVETHNSDLMCGHRAHCTTSRHPYGNPDVFQKLTRASVISVSETNICSNFFPDHPRVKVNQGSNLVTTPTPWNRLWHLPRHSTEAEAGGLGEVTVRR